MNNLIRSGGGMPAVGQRDGNWIWNGSNWICDPDCDDGSGSFPPFGPPVFSGPVAQPPWYPGANGGVSFGATPPPNPVRGHMWWDGTSFWLFDGAAWVPIGGQAASGGTATGSTPPAKPFNGQMWFNGSVLFVWDGNAWIPTTTTRSFVQPTAPPAPNPGDLWFDGAQQRIWSGSAWLLVGPGATVGPVPTTQKVFEIGTNSASTIAAANTPEIALVNGTPTVNTMGTWDVNNHTWTPNRAGVFNFEIASFNQSASYEAIYLIKNDTGFPLNVSGSQFVAIDETTSTTWLAASGMVMMNGTTDFVRLWWQNGVAAAPWPASVAGVPNIRGFIMP
jgi:hypothetical protein